MYKASKNMKYETDLVTIKFVGFPCCSNSRTYADRFGDPAPGHVKYCRCKVKGEPDTEGGGGDEKGVRSLELIRSFADNICGADFEPVGEHF